MEAIAYCYSGSRQSEFACLELLHETGGVSSSLSCAHCFRSSDTLFSNYTAFPPLWSRLHEIRMFVQLVFQMPIAVLDTHWGLSEYLLSEQILLTGHMLPPLINLKSSDQDEE